MLKILISILTGLAVSVVALAASLDLSSFNQASFSQGLGVLGVGSAIFILSSTAMFFTLRGHVPVHESKDSNTEALPSPEEAVPTDNSFLGRARALRNDADEYHSKSLELYELKKKNWWYRFGAYLGEKFSRFFGLEAMRETCKYSLARSEANTYEAMNDAREILLSRDKVEESVKELQELRIGDRQENAILRSKNEEYREQLKEYETHANKGRDALVKYGNFKEGEEPVRYARYIVSRYIFTEKMKDKYKEAWENIATENQKLKEEVTKWKEALQAERDITAIATAAKEVLESELEVLKGKIGDRRIEDMAKVYENTFNAAARMQCSPYIIPAMAEGHNKCVQLYNVQGAIAVNVARALKFDISNFYNLTVEEKANFMTEVAEYLENNGINDGKLAEVTKQLATAQSDAAYTQNKLKQMIQLEDAQTKGFKDFLQRQPNLNYSWSGYINALGNAKKVITLLLRRWKEAQSSQVKSEESLRAFKIDHQTMRRELSQARQENAAQQKRLEDAETYARQLAVAKNKVDSFQSRLDELEKPVRELSSKLAELGFAENGLPLSEYVVLAGEKIDGLVKEQQDLDNECKQELAMLLEFARLLDEDYDIHYKLPDLSGGNATVFVKVLAEAPKWKSAIEKLLETWAMCSATLSQVSDEKMECKKKIVELEAACETLAEKSETFRENFQKAREEVDAKEIQLAQLAEEFREAGMKLLQDRQANIQLEDHNKHLKERLEGVHVTCNQLEREKLTLLEERDGLIQEIEGLKQQLTEVKNAPLNINSLIEALKK